jgi:replicative DNA helicase
MITSKDAYDTFNTLARPEDFSPIGRACFGAIQEFYELDPSVRQCSRSIIESRIIGRLSSESHERAFRSYLASIPQAVSVANVERSIREVHRKGVASKLVLALANGAPDVDVTKLFRDYEAGESSEVSSEASLVDVLDTTDLTTDEVKPNEQFIRLWPKQLNDRLDGGALRGHHILVFARPETGKTLFAINLCNGFLKQRLHVLYVANEEPAAHVRDRIRGRLLKLSKAELRTDRRGAADRLDKALLGTLRIAGNTTNFGAVRRLLRDRAGVDVVILDQVRNMRMKAESRANELEAAGIEARALAKDFNCLVVSITQAGDSATGKVYLEMSDVDSSKTGIPASADLMIGLGTNEAMRASGQIGVSLPKNKLSGVHDKFLVSVNMATGVIE